MHYVDLFVYCKWVALLVSKVQAFENLALWKEAWQNNSFYDASNYVYLGANRAVDGRKQDLSLEGGQCAVSIGSTTSEWRVDLGGISSIHHIFIHYMTNNKVWGLDNLYVGAFLGFSVYISNTTNKEDGVLCFKDTNYTKATLPNPVNITCPYHGRYVIYYNNRTHPPYPVGYYEYARADLCEVEVYGCPAPGYYGENCSIPCPQNCLEGHCDVIEGTCLGCSARYRGLMCNDECEEFTYGLDCNQTCGNCSKGEQCNQVNGSCLNGCGVGVYGDKCDRECPPSRFGENCRRNCSYHCVIPGICDRVEGQCLGGCQAGWQNTQCDQECDGGMFGKYCNQSCGKCLNNEQCHHINGRCLNGCDSGYHGLTCTEECPVGLFGVNCEGFCSPNCKTPGMCDRVTGQCEGGCQDGWTQDKCDSECPAGFYGHACQESCSTNCNVSGTCDKVTGQCIGGCQPGWKESKCDKMCSNGTFGQDCNEQCGKCLGKEQCNYVNGTCVKGCKSGYQGIMCTEGQS
ncbi:uncharacterized protein LOC111114445 [Crassostrea virginica]